MDIHNNLWVWWFKLAILLNNGEKNEMVKEGNFNKMLDKL